MKIGIIGSGNVGGVLGARWAKNGHRVTFSTRDPGSDKMKKLLAEAGPTANAASTAQTAAANDILLLATPWPATKDMLSQTGDLTGKIVIDAVNPILPDLSGIEVGTDNSGAELVAQWAPGAKVVKAFNTIGNNIMADPILSGQHALLFYCGDDEAAKKIVHGLAAELGFDPEDAGPLAQARLLEPMAMLWISLAFRMRWGREFAFQVIRR
jgi:predicted dinucleotide-binding enzyme